MALDDSCYKRFQIKEVHFWSCTADMTSAVSPLSNTPTKTISKNRNNAILVLGASIYIHNHTGGGGEATHHSG